MIWVWVYLGIALVGLVMIACFAVWLWRKAVALLAEAGVLLERVDELAGLLAQIELPGDLVRAQDSHSWTGEDDRQIDEEMGYTRRQAT